MQSRVHPASIPGTALCVTRLSDHELEMGRTNIVAKGYILENEAKSEQFLAEFCCFWPSFVLTAFVEASPGLAGGKRSATRERLGPQRRELTAGWR